MKKVLLILALVLTSIFSFAGDDIKNQITVIYEHENIIHSVNEQEIPIKCSSGICEIHMPNGDGTFTVYKVCCDWIVIQPPNN